MLHLVMYVVENEVMEISLLDHELVDNHDGAWHREPHRQKMMWVNRHPVMFG